MTTTENFELKTSIHTNSQQTFDKNAILSKSSIDTVYEKEFNVVENDVSISYLKKKRNLRNFYKILQVHNRKEILRVKY